jgi:methionyl aminopeptidase
MSGIIIKNAEQIKGIRKSCRLAAKCLDYIHPYVKVGVTTDELNHLLEKYIVSSGGVPAPKGYKVGDKVYPKATCISLNEVICHGIPSDYRLKNGDILNIDVTTILDGYYGDTSRMFTVGKISQEASNLIHTCKKCLEIGIKQVKPGAHMGNIGHAIEHEARTNGYSVVTEFCGHGCGIHFHEAPNVPHVGRRGLGPVMIPGMIFTIEPMLNLGTPKGIIDEIDGWTTSTADGKLSAQWEHQILVTSDGYEILTV